MPTERQVRLKDSMRKKKQGEDDIHPLKLVPYLFKATLHCPRCKQKCSTMTVYPKKVAQLFEFKSLCSLCDALLRKKHIEDLEAFAPFDFFSSRGYQKPEKLDYLISEYTVRDPDEEVL